MDDEHDGDLLPPAFSHRNPNNKTSDITLSAIISVVVVIFLVLLLHIYAKHVLRNQARRRAVRRLSLRVSQLSLAEPPKTGLDPLVITTLPTFTFKGDDEATRPDCAVCLGTLLDEEMARLLPNCNHVFHVECIDKWLSLHATCPVCRTEAKPHLTTEPREAPALAVLSLTVGASDSEAQEHDKCSGSGSNSRVGSFRRMLSWDRSSFMRIQSFEQLGDDLEDPQIQRY